VARLLHLVVGQRARHCRPKSIRGAMTLSKMPPLGTFGRVRNELAVGRHAWLLTRMPGFEVATRASSFLRREAPIRSATLEGDRRCCDGFKASGGVIRSRPVTPVVLTGAWPTPRSAARAAIVDARTSSAASCCWPAVSAGYHGHAWSPRSQVSAVSFASLRAYSRGSCDR
jgi:hypothetical protein